MISTQQTRSRKERAWKIVDYLKRTYPRPKSELKHNSSWQLVVAVILSAQCTDERVNKVTKTLFKKYKTVNDFANADLKEFAKEISSVSFYNNKAKNIIVSAKILKEDFGGRVPKNAEELQKLPGIGYKTAHVVLGEVYDIWDGIAVDTHVRRFALKFELCNSKNPDKIAKCLEELVPKKDWKYVNNGLVLYGRYVCPARLHECSKHSLTKIYPEAANIWPKSK